MEQSGKKSAINVKYQIAMNQAQVQRNQKLSFKTLYRKACDSQHNASMRNF